MINTLKWQVRGKVLENGSKLADWQKIEQSGWHWQYDTHELSFAIYEHDGEYWKLYRARWVPEEATEYIFDYGGQACRMNLVEYRQRARSPHSNKLMQAGDLEWVRTYEADAAIHLIIKAGQKASKITPEDAV